MEEEEGQRSGARRGPLKGGADSSSYLWPRCIANHYYTEQQTQHPNSKARTNLNELKTPTHES